MATVLSKPAGQFRRYEPSNSTPKSPQSVAPAQQVNEQRREAITPPAQSSNQRGGPIEGEKAIIEFLQSEEAQSRILRAVVASGYVVASEANARCQQVTDDAIAYVSDRSATEWEKLAQCRPPSVLQSVEKLAAAGLTANRVSGDGFLRPGWNKELQTMIAAALPGIRGMERAACKDPNVATIYSACIHRQDDERQEISKIGVPYTILKKNLRIDPQQPNDIVGSTATIFMRDGNVVSLDFRITSKTVNNKEVLYVDGRRNALETGFMGPDKAAEFTSRRAVLREYLNTIGNQNEQLAAMLKMESEVYQEDDRQAQPENVRTGISETRAAIADAPGKSKGPEVHESPADDDLADLVRDDFSGNQAGSVRKNPIDGVLDRVARTSDASLEEGGMKL